MPIAEFRVSSFEFRVSASRRRTAFAEARIPTAAPASRGASHDMNKTKKILHADKGLFAGMKACLAAQHIGSALVLAYSLIDVLAWLSLPESKDDVSGQDFMDWAKEYVIPSGNLDCTGDDLYAARCGVLHTFTPGSRMARKGKAVQIVYSWGSKKPYSRKKLEALNIRFIMIHVDTLCAAIERGADRFWKHIEADRERLAVANRRADKLFNDAPQLPSELP